MRRVLQRSAAESQLRFAGTCVALSSPEDTIPRTCCSGLKRSLCRPFLTPRPAWSYRGCSRSLVDTMDVFTGLIAGLFAAIWQDVLQIPCFQGRNLRFLSLYALFPSTFASYSRCCPAVRRFNEADPPPFICHGYFGLARNAKTVISITKKRDVGHLPGGGLRRR